MKLLKALYVFERIGFDQQVGASAAAASQQSSAIGGGDFSLSISQRFSAHFLSQQAHSTGSATSRVNTQVSLHGR